jgi:hypothetical protein
MAESNNVKYPIIIAGQKMILQFVVSDAPTKLGINMQFVMEQEPSDPRDKQDLQNKLTLALQKRFSESNIAIDFNERNPYKNVISFIVPINAISNILIDTLKGK